MCQGSRGPVIIHHSASNQQSSQRQPAHKHRQAATPSRRHTKAPIAAQGDQIKGNQERRQGKTGNATASCQRITADPGVSAYGHPPRMHMHYAHASAVRRDTRNTPAALHQARHARSTLAHPSTPLRTSPAQAATQRHTRTPHRKRHAGQRGATADMRHATRGGHSPRRRSYCGAAVAPSIPPTNTACAP